AVDRGVILLQDQLVQHRAGVAGGGRGDAVAGVFFECGHELSGHVERVMRHDGDRGYGVFISDGGLVCNRTADQSERGGDEYGERFFQRFLLWARRARDAWRVPTSSASMSWNQVRGSAYALSAALGCSPVDGSNVPY